MMMMMEIDNNNDNEQQCIVKCEEEEEQNGGRMNGGGDEKKKTTKQRTSDEEEDNDDDDDDDDDVESVDDEEMEKTREKRRRMGEERRGGGGGAKSTVSSNSCGMIDDDDDDEGVEMRSTKSAMIITTIINRKNTVHEKEGDDVGLKGKCGLFKNNEKERDLECFGSTVDDDDGVDYEGDEFDDCGEKDVDWNSSVGGDFARGGKEKRRKNSNDNNEQNEKNIVNEEDGRTRIASRSASAPAGVPDDDDEEEMNDGGGGMSDLASSNNNNNNNLMMNLNGMEGCKRANVRIVFSDITNINNNMEGGSEMSKRRSCDDNENNETFPSSSILFGIGKRSRIESEEGRGSAFRRVNTLEKHGLSDERWNGCESGNRFDFGSDVVAVKKEKMDDLESGGMMMAGDVVANSNGEEEEMDYVDRAEDGFELGVKSEKDGFQIQSASPPIGMHEEEDEGDYEECAWSSSDEGKDDDIANDGNSSDASYHPSPIVANRRQARPSQHRKENGSEACKRRGSVVRSDKGDQEAEDDDEIVNHAASTSGSSRRPPGYWGDFSNVERELRSFMERMGDKIKPGAMPTFSQLRYERRSNLETAIYKHGGLAAVGERLGLAAPAPTKPQGYWNDFSNVEKEIRSFIEQMGDKIEPGRMPTTKQLRVEGCRSLSFAIYKHGGLPAVRERMGLASAPPTKLQGYWNDFSNVGKELRSFIERMGDKIEPGRMPTTSQLLAEGCGGLVNAIQKHGGVVAVGKRLGLAVALSTKLQGYWDNFSNVEKELRSFIERMGDKIEPGTMPTQSQFLDEGHTNLETAIRKHGGLVAVGERLGFRRKHNYSSIAEKKMLPPASSHPVATTYWDDFANVEMEIRGFIIKMGSKIEVGKMPTVRQLIVEGRGDLSAAIYKHGGYEQVGERIGLAASSSTIAAVASNEFSSGAAEGGSIGNVTRSKRRRHQNFINSNPTSHTNREADGNWVNGADSDSVVIGRRETFQDRATGNVILHPSSTTTNDDEEEIVYATRSERSRVDSPPSSSSQVIPSHVSESNVNLNQQFVEQSERETEDDDDEDGSSIASFCHLDDIEQELRMESDDSCKEVSTAAKKRRVKETSLDQGTVSGLGSQPARTEAMGDIETIDKSGKNDRARRMRGGRQGNVIESYSNQEEGEEAEMNAEEDDDEDYNGSMWNGDNASDVSYCPSPAANASTKRRPKGHWNDFANVDKELRAFIERMGDKIEPGRMPTKKHFREQGCDGLRVAIEKHGGLVAVGKRLGLAAPPPTKPQGYWDDFSNVGKELRSVIERMGDQIESGRMPTFSQFQNAGCSGLKHAIQKHGGMAAVGERLGLAVHIPTKPQGYWDDFANVERELRSFIEQMGDKIESGTMPTRKQLQDEGCSGLVYAIRNHGGFAAVGKRLGLAASSPQ